MLSVPATEQMERSEAKDHVLNGALMTAPHALHMLASRNTVSLGPALSIPSPYLLLTVDVATHEYRCSGSGSPQAEM